MAYPNKTTLADKYYNAYLADVSADSSAFIPIVGQGMLIGVRTVLGVAITGADAGLTIKKNGTAITGATITITQASSAAGDVDTVDITPTPVGDGDYIEIDSDGNSSTTAPLYITAIVREL